MAWVNLTVVVPPTKTEVITRVSPVNLGDRNDVICKAYGGKSRMMLVWEMRVYLGCCSPSPQVLWLQEGKLVDSTYTIAGNETYNVLEVEASRGDLTSPFLCRATNNDRTGPDEVEYLRNVTCGPLTVTITGEEEPIAEGRTATITCTVLGSNPPALVTWYQQGQMIKPLHTMMVCRAENKLIQNNALEDIFTLDVQYKPILRMTLGRNLDHDDLREGNDLFFDCNIDANPAPYKVEWWHDNQFRFWRRKQKERTLIEFMTQLSRKGYGRLSDKLLLSPLFCKRIFLLAESEIGCEAYNTRTRSDHHRLLVPFFTHQGELVSHNVSGGVLVSESTLALQKVRREKSGQYQCSASNVEGDTTSDPVNITIKYAPRCSVSPSLRGVGLLEPLNVTCLVDADPPDVTFSWTFNNSVRREQSEVVSNQRSDEVDYQRRLGQERSDSQGLRREAMSRALNDNRYTTERLRSVLFYTPMTERDYGTLLCHASNSIGTQKTPCSFTVISAGPPEEVTGCTVDNVTSHSSSIVCSPGFNGGLPQMFLLQVWKEEPPKVDELVVNISLAQSEFLVRSLVPGHHYRSEVTAHNARGAAPPVTLHIHTLKEAEMHKSLPSRSEPSPLMLVLAVIGGALLVVVMLLVGVWAVRGRRRHSHAHRENVHIPMKESNPDILEAAPQPPTSAHTITISVIKQPHQTYDGEPSPPPPDVGAEELGMGMGLRPGLPSQKTVFGASEPLHRPIEKSLQTPVCHPYDDDPPSSPEVTERTQLTTSTIDTSLGITLGVEAAARSSRRLPYSRTPLYEELDIGSSTCVLQPLMLGSSESVM
ncbi:Nephrin-like 22 [Homarus americanus]|uniref:Nephrin-like 22 n=1 Tax=Homarus americanus TaxID=6706 RepID=A0A8J5JHD5_HOMAM|nr:Nephrin-like 22 [Homarus americanus]